MGVHRPLADVWSPKFLALRGVAELLNHRTVNSGARAFCPLHIGSIIQLSATMSLSLSSDILNLVYDLVPLQPCLINALHVSQHWRETALAHPTFWRHVRLSGAISIPKVALFEAQLAASSLTGLNLAVHVSEPDETPQGVAGLSHRVVNTIRANIHRVRRLAVYDECTPIVILVPVIDIFRERVFQALEVDNGSELLPELEAIDLACANEWRHVFLPTTLSYLATNLQHISLRGIRLCLEDACKPPRHSQFPNVTRLILHNIEDEPTMRRKATYQEIDLSTIANMFPALEHLSCYSCALSHDDSKVKDRLTVEIVQTGLVDRLQTLGLHWSFMRHLLDLNAKVQMLPTLVTHRDAESHSARIMPPIEAARFLGFLDPVAGETDRHRCKAPMSLNFGRTHIETMRSCTCADEPKDLCRRLIVAGVTQNLATLVYEELASHVVCLSLSLSHLAFEVFCPESTGDRLEELRLRVDWDPLTIAEEISPRTRDTLQCIAPRLRRLRFEAEAPGRWYLTQPRNESPRATRSIFDCLVQDLFDVQIPTMAVSIAPELLD